MFHETCFFWSTGKFNIEGVESYRVSFNIFQKCFWRKTLKWYTDNRNRVKIVKPGSMNKSLQLIALSIFLDFNQRCISIVIPWISRQNKTDRFANYQNTKVCRYNYLFWNPYAISVDDFTLGWSNENNWLEQPVYFVIRCIKHLIYCKAK